MSSPQSYELIVKLVVVGGPGVGKTSLIHYYTNGEELTSPSTTIGVDHSLMCIDTRDTEVTLQMWDSAGNKKYRGNSKHLYTGMNCCVLVFDVGDADSFAAAVELWESEVAEYATRLDFMAAVLVANKIDTAKTQRKVGKAEAKKWASDNGMVYWETSAVSGAKVADMFVSVVDAHLKARTEAFRERGNLTLLLRATSSQGSSGSLNSSGTEERGYQASPLSPRRDGFESGSESGSGKRTATEKTALVNGEGGPADAADYDDSGDDEDTGHCCRCAFSFEWPGRDVNARGAVVVGPKAQVQTGDYVEV